MKIRGKSPLRISFAGGGTDLNYIFEKYGGAVVNCTIDKYCHMTIEKRNNKKILINEKSYEQDVLAKIVIDHVNPEFGFNLTYYNDISPGSGLGSSSSFVVLLLTLLYELKGVVKTDEEIVTESYVIENLLKENGWQDLYATSIGGFNFMEFGDKTLIYPLRLRYRYLQELSEHLLLVDIGGNKEERDLHKELRKYQDKNSDELEKTIKIKDLAYQIRDCLLNQKIDEIGQILKENWRLKRNKITSNVKIEKIYNIALENGAEGGKLCGSGQAGHMLLFVKPENKNKLISVLNLPVVNFNLNVHGTETWNLK